MKSTHRYRLRHRGPVPEIAPAAGNCPEPSRRFRIRLRKSSATARPRSGGESPLGWAPLAGRGLCPRLIWRNLLTEPRRWRFHAKRAGLLALGGAVLIVSYAMSGQSNRSALGLEVFTTLAYGSLLILGFAALLSSIHAFEEERDSHTLEILALTDIGHEELLAGGILPDFFTSTFAALSFLPLFILLVQTGGVSTAQILAAYAILIPTIFLCHAMGIWLTTVVRQRSRLYLAMGLTLLGYFVILPVLILFLFIFVPFDFDALDLVSPFASLSGVCGGTHLIAAPLNGAFNLLVGGILLRSAWKRLATLSNDLEWITGDRESNLTIFPGLAAFPWLSGAPRTRTSRVVDSADPVFWRDAAIVYPRTRSRAWLFAIALLLTGSLPALVEGIGLVMDVPYTTGESFLTLLFAGFAFAGLAFIPAFVFLCANAFGSERNSGVLEILRLSSIGPARIVWAKFRAAAFALWPLLAIASTSAALFFIVSLPGNHPVSMNDAGPVLSIASYAAAYSALAMALSLRLKRPAVIVTGGLVLILSVIAAGFVQDELARRFGLRGIPVHCLLNAVVLVGSWVAAIRMVRRPCA
jgi:ABC-type transport system involved in multi-copper enzyme maturation permease subunit